MPVTSFLDTGTVGSYSRFSCTLKKAPRVPYNGIPKIVSRKVVVGNETHVPKERKFPTSFLKLITSNITYRGASVPKFISRKNNFAI